METIMENYKDPKDLREIPIERLKFEGNQLAHQHDQWDDLFNIQSAIRVRNKKATSGSETISELEMWCILSNRFLLMEREHLTDFKLFTKDEVLRMIQDAYRAGFNKCKYDGPGKELKDEIEMEQQYLATKQSI